MVTSESTPTPRPPASSKVLAAGIRLLPYVVLLISLGSTLALWWMADGWTRQRDQAVLARRSDAISTGIIRRMQDDEQILLGALGLFRARDEVSRDEWRRYVAALRMDQNFPGIQGVGYTVWLPTADKASHEARIRAEGFPEYRIRPDGARNTYTSIVYLEPFDWRNQRAFGFDMYSEPTRHAAMDRARDSGTTAMSDRVTLVQETEKDTQNGVLLYVPVYRAGMPTDTIEARRSALQGFVYSPIRLANLVIHSLGTLPEDIDFAIGTAAAPEALFNSRTAAGPASRDSSVADHTHALKQSVALFGQQWEFTFVPRRGGGLDTPRWQPLMVLGAGLVLTTLLSAIAFILRTSRTRELAHQLQRLELTRQRTLMEASPDGMVIIDPDSGRITEFNTAAHRQLGYTREKFAVLRVFDIEAIETADETRAHMDDVLRRGRSDFETKQRKRDGTLLDVHVTAQTLDVAGLTVYFCTWRNITERKEAELRLREGEERFRAMFENSPDAHLIMEIGDGGRISACNKAAEVMLRGTKAEILGKTPEQVAPERQPDGRLSSEAVAEKILECVARGRSDFEWMHRRLDGEDFWAHITISVIGMDGRQVLFVSWRDITDRKQAERDRLVLSKLESTGILAGGIAHDFNNLLSVIMLNAQIAEADLSPSSSSRTGIRDAIAAARAAQRLTQQLITFAKGGDPVRKLTDIGQLVQESVGLALSGSNVAARFVVEPGAWRAELDAGQVAQVFRNLAINAREAMPTGGLLTIGVENTQIDSWSPLSVRPGPYVRIVFTDTGGGIAPDVLPRIFDPYFSTKQRGSDKGMGLGLTICHSVVQRHRGAIGIESETGRGARFTVYLPAAPDSAAAPDLQPAAAPAALGGAPRMRLLVMDDEDRVRRSVTLAAERLGCACSTAADGRAALDAYRSQAAAGRPFDVVLLDLTVREGLGGRETVLVLRREFPEANVVLMTGYTESEVARDYAAYGFNAVLLKPIALADLSRVLSAEGMNAS